MAPMSCHSNSHNDTSGLWESNPRSNSLCKSWLFPLSHCWQMVNWVNGHRSFWGTIVAHTFCSVARSFLLRTQPPLQSLGRDMKIASSLVTEQELSFLLWLHLTPPALTRYEGGSTDLLDAVPTPGPFSLTWKSVMDGVWGITLPDKEK